MKTPPRLQLPAVDPFLLPPPPRPHRPWDLRSGLFWAVAALGLLLVGHLIQAAFSGVAAPLNHVPREVAPPPSASPLAERGTPLPGTVVVSAAPEVVSRQPYVRVWAAPLPVSGPQTAAVVPPAGQTAQAMPNGVPAVSGDLVAQATPPGPTATPALTASPSPLPTPTPTVQPSSTPTPAPSPRPSPTPRPRPRPSGQFAWELGLPGPSVGAKENRR